MAIGIFDGHLVYLMVIWYIFPRFGKYYSEKSGNTGGAPKTGRNFRQSVGCQWWPRKESRRFISVKKIMNAIFGLEKFFDCGTHIC
jgi:hypothetical protein